MTNSKLKWIGLTLAGLSAAAFTGSAMASADLMKVSPDGHFIRGKYCEDRWYAFTGRFHFDYVAFSAPRELYQRFKYASSFNMRRTYFGVMGNLGCDFGYRIGLEFLPSSLPHGNYYHQYGETSSEGNNNGTQYTGGRIPRGRDLQGGDNYEARNSIAVKFLPTFIQYHGLCDNINISIGNIAPPMGLENWGGNNVQPFMEGSLLTRAFAPQFSTGIMADGYFECFNLSAAIFTHSGNYNQVPADVRPTGDIPADPNSDLSALTGIDGDVRARRVNDRFSFAARATTSPFSCGGCKYHLGASLWYADFATEGREGAPLQTAPHTTIHPGLVSRSTDFLISSSPYPTNVLYFRADNMLQYAVEAAASWGSFHGQLEFADRQFRRSTEWGFNGTDFHQTAYDVVLGWVITGESRPYDMKTGTIGNPVPCRPCCGAFEAVVRFEQLKLAHGDLGSALNTDPAGVGGPFSGKQTNFVVGLNWFINKHVRMRANYLYGKATELEVKHDGWKVTGYGLRAEIDF